MTAALDDLCDEDLRPLSAWDAEPSGFNLDLALMLDPATLDGEALIAYLRNVERLQACLADRSHVAVARLTEVRPGDAAEVLADTLDETITTAEHRCAASARLFRVHAATLRRMDHGEVLPRHATVLERTCRHLPAGVALSVDDVVWDVTRRPDPAEVRRAAVALAVAIDPAAADVRARTERADRGISVFPQSDGTGLLEVKLPAEDCGAVRDELNRATATHDPADPRTRQQRLADLLVARITGAPASLSGGFDDATPRTCRCGGKPPRDRRVEIGVTIGLDVLLGLTETSAGGPPTRVCTIDGQPVAPAVARALLRPDTAVLRRLVTDPVTGHLLDAHPTTYKPGADLVRFVRRRDQECLWPGCHRTARTCDLDHHQPFPEGPTTRANLGPFCEHHHQLKHTHGWTFSRHPDGSATLRGPLGDTRRIHPWRTDGPIDRLPPPTSPDDPGPDPNPATPTAPEDEPATSTGPDVDPPF